MAAPHRTTPATTGAQMSYIPFPALSPEIFSVASPSSGLMFSNDVMPVKVRWFYAAGPMDFRGLYKANVA